MPVAELNNSGTPGSVGTTLVQYSPTTPLTLAPTHVYFIGVTAGPGSPGDPSLIFANTESYSVTPDWQTYVGANNNQWLYDPNFNGWVSGAPNGSEGLKLEIDASLVPEPAIGFILAMAIAVASRRRGTFIKTSELTDADTEFVR